MGVEARRGLKRDLDARKERKRDERDDPGERRREKKGDADKSRDGRRKRESAQKREGSWDKRSSRSQSVRSSREEDHLIEDVVGDPDLDQGELLQIMELAQKEQ